MNTKLLSLLVGVAVLGSAGAVNAADVAAPTEKKVVVLTDTQMDEVTAGHLYEPPVINGKYDMTTAHQGWYWIKLFSIFGKDVYGKAFGTHIGCGKSHPPGTC